MRKINGAKFDKFNMAELFPRWRDFLDIAPDGGNTRKDGICGFQCQSYTKHN